MCSLVTQRMCCFKVQLTGGFANYLLRVIVKMTIQISTLLFGIICIYPALSNVFNYEISSRVEDKIADFTLMVSKTLEEPLRTIYAGYLNISDGFSPTRPLFYAPQLAYKSLIANIYSGFENNFTYGYGIDPSLPDDLYIAWTVPAGGQNINFITYSVLPSGAPGNYCCNSSYIVTQRPWYVTAKVLQSSYWTAPYIDAVSGLPIITLVYPIQNVKFQGVVSRFVGTVAIDVYLKSISLYLKQAYQNTDRNVFVIDRNTLILIGTSLNASTSMPDPSLSGNLVSKNI